jgi:DNA-binding PadR family transcriptional regulator
LILGLLLRGPLHGYELHRIVRAHGELYTDLKKANLYYLLDRLAREGSLAVTAEPGARGARGERLVYALTDRGRERFHELLRAVLRTYEPVHIGVDVAVLYLPLLPQAEAVRLLEERLRVVGGHRARVTSELGDLSGATLPGSLAADHLLSLIDAELAWVGRALARLREAGWARADAVPEPSSASHGGATPP